MNPGRDGVVRNVVGPCHTFVGDRRRAGPKAHYLVMGTAFNG
jgi:hypothetical protein